MAERGRTWSDDEIAVLLELWGERHYSVAVIKSSEECGAVQSNCNFADRERLYTYV